MCQLRVCVLAKGLCVSYVFVHEIFEQNNKCTGNKIQSFNVISKTALYIII